MIGKSRIRVVVLADGTWLVAVEAADGLDKLPSLIKMNQVINSNSPLSGIKSISYGHQQSPLKLALLLDSYLYLTPDVLLEFTN